MCFGPPLEEGRRLTVGEAAGLQDYLLGFGLRYDHLGDGGYRHVIRCVGRARNVRRRARAVYSFTPLHRTLWPLTRALRSSPGSEGRHPADANAGDRAPAT